MFLEHHCSTSSVITDTECCGSVTVNDGPAPMFLVAICTASGWLKSLEVARLSPFTVSICACRRYTNSF